jgi:hypothetical protein
MTNNGGFADQLESLYGISVQIASLRDLSEVYDLALTFCLALTASEMGFVDRPSQCLRRRDHRRPPEHLE